MVVMPTTQHIHENMAEHGYALVPANVITPFREYPADWLTLTAALPDLPPDPNTEAGHTRYRRQTSFTFNPPTGDITPMPHDAEALPGVAPLTADLAANPLLHALIRWDFAQFPILDPSWRGGTWQVDVRLISIVVAPEESGTPPAERIIRNGAAFTAVHLAALDNADGAYVTIYDPEQQPLECFRLNHVMHSYLYDDVNLYHGVTAVRRRDGERPASRSVLRFDYHFNG